MSISGSPAATSEPNASTRMTSVTGQLKSSDFIIAVRLAALKSDHIPLAPVSETCTPSPCRRCSWVLRSSAARTMVLASAAAPACTIAVWPSREIDSPGCGATTDFTRAIGLQRRAASRRPPAGTPGRSTVLSASARRPSGRWRTGPGSSCRSPCARRPTPSPWPPSRRPTAPSRPSGRTRRAPTATSTQAIATARKCVAV